MPLTTIPSSYVADSHPTRSIKVTAHIYVVSTSRYGIDIVTYSVIRTAAQRMPLAAIPSSYVACGDVTVSRIVEVTAHIDIVTADSYCIYIVAVIHITYAAAKGIPLA